MQNFLKISLRIGILICLICMPFFTAADELPDFRRGKSKAKDNFKMGLKYFHRAQFGAAKENFIASLSVMEDFHLARKFLSDTYFLSGEWQESLNELEILDRSRKNPYWKNRIEVLRLLIAGEGKTHPLTFYNKILGDDYRGYRFENPTDALVDENGNLFILSFKTGNIVKFDTNGFPRGNFKGGFARSMKGPMFFTLFKNNLYVSDFTSDKIYVFNTKGYFKTRFGKKGTGKGEFIGPAGIAVSSREKIYIADSGNNRIQKYDLDGNFLQSFGTKGRGKLYSPAGITVSEDETIYVVDKGHRRIVNFDDEGNYIGELTHPDFIRPRSIKIYNNKLYITDEDAGLMIYDPQKVEWSHFPSYMDETGKYNTLLRPFSCAHDYTGAFYTIDNARHRVDIFTPRNTLGSNLNVFVEKVILNRFPDISLLVNVKDRLNKNLKGINRSAFRIIENENIYPLVGLADMKRFNDRISVAFVFENSPAIHNISEKIPGFMGHLFGSFTEKDRVEVIRAGNDSVRVYDFGYSVLDVYSKIRKSQAEKGFINLGKGIFEGISDLNDRLGPKALVVLVSGEKLDNSFKQYDIIRNIQYANAHSIPIIFLSLKGDGEMVSQYKDMAEKTDGLFIKVPGSQEEKNLYKFIKSKKDKRYIVSYRTKTASELGGKYMDIQVDVFHRRIIGKARTGYFVPEDN
ncbi:MAG: NHL repeat-containing protein [Leptospiraceae bacterium]|nr:NHL repeat-containing protein [Leptospiraceae bacterium]